MTLAAGTRLGSYEILSAIGAGGMGEVYRARDTRLHRDIALKILPESFSGDHDRVARFAREAQLLAALNHPNIASIYGFEEASPLTDSGSSASAVATVPFLALELVEGETLAQRLAGAPTGLPVAEALAVARQVADALQAAHDKGIVHRDLKPANIAFTAEGTIKILDFGLAKMLEAGSGAREPAGTLGAAQQDAAQGFRPALTNSPTLSLAMTQAGMILGTAAYMSPEQAKGRPADKRADVWAFGCVLFEMLAGKRAFEGEDASDTLAAVLRGEPDWNALPRAVPPNVRLILKGCLEKDRKARFADISIVCFLLNESPSSQAQPAGVFRRRTMLIAAGGLALAGISTLATWLVTRPGPPSRALQARFAITLPATAPAFSFNGTERALAFSPDATHIVYVVGAGQLMVRAIDQLEGEPLPGISFARAPFVSPDGKWVGFSAGGNELRKVSIAGGPTTMLCRTDGAPRGASWGPNGTIVFATVSPSTGLQSVPAGGGDPKVLTRPDAARGERDHLFPSFLPDGRAVLFTVATPGTNSQVEVLNLDTGERKILIRGGSHAEYVDGGYMVYTQAGALRAVRFDPVGLEVLGDPVPVGEQVLTMANGAAEFSVSRTGALVYAPGAASGETGAPRSLVWVSRDGREESIGAPPRTYSVPRLSPDGTRIAVSISDQELDIWIWDLNRATLTRLTFDPGNDQQPLWTPDGRRIVFASNRGASASNVFWQQADGTGTAERLTTGANTLFTQAISPDGSGVVLLELRAGTDLMLLHLGEKPRIEPLLQTPFTEAIPDFSPDGRWIAYQSNESGQNQVYVRPFPNVNGGRWQVSTTGGSRPVWARSGRELFYAAPGGSIMAVPVQTTSSFSAGNPAKLFEWAAVEGTLPRSYDVSRDGRRFLMIKEGAGTQPSNTQPASMVVVLNWVEELRQRVTSGQR